MSEDEQRDQEESPSTLSLVPGVARLAAVAWWRTANWAAESSLRAGGRVLSAARSGQSPADVLELTGRELRSYIRQLLEIVDSEAEAPEEPAESNGDIEALRRRAADLLRQSAEVGEDLDATHPAYERILGSMAPDEGRVLRLLATRGAQPSVDVRTARPLDIGSELIAPGLTMMGAEAGCRSPDKVHSYLNNLYRLGLVWFSREALADQGAYQVLEAQPEVSQAMDKGGRCKTVRRSIHLTPFGEDFCATVLPLDTEELEALPKDDDGPPLAGEIDT
jgi:hypothetical protein